MLRKSTCKITFASLFFVVICLTGFANASVCNDINSDDPSTLVDANTRETLSALKNFKVEYNARMTFVDTYPGQTKLFASLLKERRGKITADDFVSIALYIIHWKSTYVGGRANSILENYILEVYELIQAESLNYELTLAQANLLREAILSQPNSWREMFTLKMCGWDTGGKRKVYLLTRRPFGKAGYVYPEKTYPLTPKGFFQEFKMMKFLDDSYDGRRDALLALLVKYGRVLPADQFTSICLDLVTWHFSYKDYGGFMGVEIAKVFETIRQATLEVKLSKDQVTQIKTAMLLRPGNLREYFGISGGWEYGGRAALGELIVKPFGNPEL